MKKFLALLVTATLMLSMVCAFATAETTGSVYYLNFKPEQDQQWQDLAAKYTEETGVPVTVVTAASGTYDPTLTSELEKADAPTLFQVNGPVGLATRKSYCADLKGTELYAQLKSDDFALKDGDAVLGIAYVIETYGIIYNKELLAKYCALDNAVIKDAAEIVNFATLKAVADDIQARKDEMGVVGAFASAGMDSSSDWRFKTHLANLPIYYEYQADGIGSTEAIKGTYLDNYKQIWDLYITDATCEPAMIGAKTGEDALADFTLGEAVFYQNGTWAYGDCINAGMTDEQLGMLPIYIGVEGEENQGLCTGSENYWCINNKASAENIKATEDFLAWVVTSDTGRDALANQMGFVTPFKAFDEGYTANNALIKAADEYIAAGKTSVAWCFTTMPSETWKNNVGSALLEYAQGTGEWDAVKTAFVDSWATEYAAAAK
ncbi:MAG: ABC transporter substrate-binding protein [Eubacteriales bacterium]|nr:ABC transporter substrate-binding protein [Eubacteriales bacterium]